MDVRGGHLGEEESYNVVEAGEGDKLGWALFEEFLDVVDFDLFVDGHF